jgi:site-specific recombinase
MREPTLDALLGNLLSAKTGSGALEDLLHWIRAASPEAADGGLPPRTLRLRRLVASFRAHPDAAELEEALGAALRQASAIRLLAEIGLPDRSTFFGEALRKVVDGLVPRGEASEDLYAIFARLRFTESDADWIERLSEEDIAPLRNLLPLEPAAWTQAVELLAARTAAVGLGRDLLDLDPGHDGDSPFLRLPEAAKAWSLAPQDGPAQSAWDEARSACRARLQRATEQLDEQGVSTDLVYRMELIEAQLARLDTLLHAAAGREDKRVLAAQLVRDAARHRSLRAHLGTTLKRLARKVVEHMGETGEHYIVRDRKEWNIIGWAAAGAGVLTVGTALGKYALGALPLSPLVEGLGFAANYALSFILMQFFGLVLASKQPSMTASALAAGLEREDGMDEEVELVAAITRSQAIATLGNVLATVPVSLLACWIWWKLSGAPLLSAETAHHGLQSLHPLFSWTVPFAIFTGVCLWLQSLAAGWAGNWAAYRRLPEAIVASPRIRRALGLKGAQRLAEGTRRHLSGIIGYITLGLLLGFVPVVVSKFIGIHLEVRHVTLQASSLALDVGSLWHTADWRWSEALLGFASIAVIGFFNFSVSFWLALRTAMRARDLDPKGRRELRRRILKALNERPGRFLWAPGRMDTSSPGSSHA